MSFDFKKDPIENFLNLYREAQIRGVPDAHAMALATVNKQNQPSVRIVYYKGMNDGGFSFYTNYMGRKALDIENNHKVSANFFWPNLDQQVRIEGVSEKLSREDSEKYFASRPRQSQIGAWASHQSEVIDSYDLFQKKFHELELQFHGQNVPCPPHWGGYRILPLEIEFWFGRSGRLHERYVYHREDVSSVAWKRFLRSP